MSTSQPIGIIGAGAWGTAIAINLQGCGHRIQMWAKEPKVVKDISRRHRNDRFLPGFDLSPHIEATTNLEDLARSCKVLFVATSAAANTTVAALLSKTLTPDHVVVLASKGFRETDGALLSDVWHELVPQLKHLAIFSGPTFAADFAQGLPTAAVLAAEKQETLDIVNDLFTRDNVRLYFNHDIIGAQVGAALKNVIAVAAGINDGLDLGENLRTAIICRGLAEMSRYAEALGGRRETIAGLSGMGDVILTCTSSQSRNYRFGATIARGLSRDEAESEINAVVEGIHTARIVTMQGVARGIDMAIIMAVDGIISGDVAPDVAMRMLLARPRSFEY